MVDQEKHTRPVRSPAPPRLAPALALVHLRPQVAMPGLRQHGGRRTGVPDGAWTAPGPAGGPAAGQPRGVERADRRALDRAGGPDHAGAGGPGRQTAMTDQPPARLGGWRAPIRPHLPIRPLWLCRACAAPWPCAPARLSLGHRYAGDPAGLRLHLRAMLDDATADLRRLNPQPGPDPESLSVRFKE